MLTSCMHHSLNHLSTYSHYLLSLSPPSKNIKIKVLRNVILSVILCGHETGSVTLNEEHGLMNFMFVPCISNNKIPLLKSNQ
jgi:hypothetical protein